MNDCPFGEEELHCGILTCPGLLRCKTEIICVSRYQVCDGVVHCPISGDNEVFCDLPQCPRDCKCHGLAITCSDMNLISVPTYHTNTLAMDLSRANVILSVTV